MDDIANLFKADFHDLLLRGPYCTTFRDVLLCFEITAGSKRVLAKPNSTFFNHCKIMGGWVRNVDWENGVHSIWPNLWRPLHARSAGLEVW